MRTRNRLCLDVLAVGLAVSMTTALLPDRVPVQLPEDPAPGDALYVEPRFEAALTAEDVPYGQAVNVDGDLQTLGLDIHEPVGHDDEFRPVVIWATGGGFTRLANLPYFYPDFVERGYVVLNVDYRVRPEMPHGFEDFISPDGAAAVIDALEAARDGQHDVQAAIRWARANAADLGIDPNQIVVAGYSAGGAAAWLAAYNTDDPGSSGTPDQPSDVAAAVIGAGGYILGPQGVALPGRPPLVAFHGVQDTTVPVVSSTGACAQSRAVGNVCEYHLYPDRSHNLSIHYRDIAALSADFLWRHVHSIDRTATAFTELGASGLGGDARITGRLVSADGAPVADARVLARATAGWVEAITAADGSFALLVPAPDHGRQTAVRLRYEGDAGAGGPLAPTADQVTASWGSDRP